MHSKRYGEPLQLSFLQSPPDPNKNYQNIHISGRVAVVLALPPDPNKNYENIHISGRVAVVLALPPRSQ